MKKRGKKYAVVLSVLFFFSCGMDDYMYLDPVPLGNVTRINNTLTRVTLPGSSEYYFSFYGIYYRIYISDVNITFEPAVNYFSTLNSALGSDFAAVEPYFDETSTNTTNTSAIGDLFNGRKYNRVAIEGTNIETLLSSQANGKTITLDFVQTAGGANIPYLGIDDTAYRLRRNSSIPGVTNFDPEPDYYFRNTIELSDNIYAGQNTDVQPKSGIVGPKYAYAAFFILSIGLDENVSPIYSRPTFLGIMKLPDVS